MLFYKYLWRKKSFSQLQLDAVQLFCSRKAAIALNGMKVCSYAFSQLKTFTTEHSPWSTKIFFSEIRSWAAKKISRVNCIYWSKTLLQIQICPRIILYVIVKLITFRTEQIGVGLYINNYSNFELKFYFKLFKTILYSFFMSIYMLVLD